MLYQKTSEKKVAPKKRAKKRPNRNPTCREPLSVGTATSQRRCPTQPMPSSPRLGGELSGAGKRSDQRTRTGEPAQPRRHRKKKAHRLGSCRRGRNGHMRHHFVKLFAHGSFLGRSVKKSGSGKPRVGGA